MAVLRPGKTGPKLEDSVFGEAQAQAAQDQMKDFLSRATGQQYLLGVGKADITG